MPEAGGAVRSVLWGAMARRLARAEPPLVFGEHRIAGGWLGIGIAGAAFVIIGMAMLAAGAPEVLLAVGPILAVFAALCATTRVVRLDPEAREVVVTRRLLGLGHRRRWPLDRFRTVAVTMHVFIPRFARTDGTLAGRQAFMHFDITLRGRWRRIRLPDGAPVEADAAKRRDAAEERARRLAALLGLAAERRGYRIEDTEGGTLTVPRRRAVEPLG